MKVIVIQVVIGAFGTVTKGLLKGLEGLEVGGRMETMQTTTLLRTTRKLKRVPETWGDLLSLKLQWRPSGARGVMIIVVGNGHGDTSSNPEQDQLHFT